VARPFGQQADVVPLVLDNLLDVGIQHHLDRFRLQLAQLNPPGVRQSLVGFYLSLKRFVAGFQVIVLQLDVTSPLLLLFELPRPVLGDFLCGCHILCRLLHVVAVALVHPICLYPPGTHFADVAVTLAQVPQQNVCIIPMQAFPSELHLIPFQVEKGNRLTGACTKQASADRAGEVFSSSLHVEGLVPEINSDEIHVRSVLIAFEKQSHLFYMLRGHLRRLLLLLLLKLICRRLLLLLLKPICKMLLLLLLKPICRRLLKLVFHWCSENI